MNDFRDQEIMNPFVQRLPPIVGKAEQFKLLRKMPQWSQSERQLPHVERRYRVLRLLDYMDPFNSQVDLVERIDMAIRQGYRGRNPATLSYRKSLLDSAQAISDGRDPLADFEGDNIRVEEGIGYSAEYAGGDPRSPRMPGFSVIGLPGMGKSATIERILHRYPLTIVHTDTRDMITQVPALKIECPSMGSRKSFCIEFFRLLDDRLKQKGGLFKMYTGRGAVTDDMLANVQHLVRLHAIGLLVVDEIQNLNAGKEGIKPMVNFLVSMANKIGVGIVMVGTMTARNIPQAAFHSARRAAGLGSFIWDRFHPGKEWDDFVESMWTYQWTAKHTPIDASIKVALYNHSQGVIDVVTKLFILAQLRVITNAELNNVPELLTVDLFDAVAHDELAILAPMIEALRTGDYDKLAKFPDLRPFHDHFRLVIEQSTGHDADHIRQKLRAEEAAERSRAEGIEDQRREFYIGMLRSYGHSPADAHRALDLILERVDPADVDGVGRAMAQLPSVVKAMSSRASKAPRRKVVNRVAIPGDLRDVLSSLADGDNMHSALQKLGIACSPTQAITAITK